LNQSYLIARPAAEEPTLEPKAKPKPKPKPKAEPKKKLVIVEPPG